MEPIITIVLMALVATMVFINVRLWHNSTKQQKEFYAEKESLIWQLERKDEMLKNASNVEEKYRELEKRLKLFERPAKDKNIVTPTPIDIEDGGWEARVKEAIESSPWPANIVLACAEAVNIYAQTAAKVKEDKSCQGNSFNKQMVTTRLCHDYKSKAE